MPTETKSSSGEGELSQRSFSLPAFSDNVDGWGPQRTNIPEHLADVPFAPFNKGDRLGRISDFTASKTQTGQTSNPRVPRTPAGSNVAFSYKHEEDEESFELVDRTAKPKPFNRRRGAQTPWVQRGGARGGAQGGWQQRGGRGGQRGGWGNQRGRGGQRGGRWGYNQWGQDQRAAQQLEVREPSVVVKDEWKPIEEIDFSDLTDEGVSPSTVETLVEAGLMHGYNTAYDGVTPRQPKPLQRFEKVQHFTPGTTEDPILQRLMQEGEGNVFGTDTILALLMASPKTVNSWDIVCTKRNGMLIFDKRPTSRIDFLTVNENWSDVITTDKESPNHPKNLSVEATFINQNFTQMVLNKSAERALEQGHPFTDSLNKGMQAASVGYRYRRWTMGDINLVVRSSVNSFVPGEDEESPSYVIVRALNESDSKLTGGVDWKQKLEAQTGAVLATEMKNNAAKLARWTAETLLSGADEIRLGFVARNNAADATKHSLLMVKKWTLPLFRQTLGVRFKELWAPLHKIIETMQAQDDGKYLLYKDPSKSTIQIFSVPATAFVGEKHEDFTLLSPSGRGYSSA